MILHRIKRATISPQDSDIEELIRTYSKNRLERLVRQEAYFAFQMFDSLVGDKYRGTTQYGIEKRQHVNTYLRHFFREKTTK